MIIVEEKSIVDKIMDDEPLTKHDIQALGMFNDHYIDLLLNAGQKVVRRKVAESLVRAGMMEVG
ncbi:hypothetical protein ACFOU0_06000 [Salinicoccus sesuvii]|uniref:Uncharacterized protein n=1 Tax=Salinicoccus sesuvii TaxID=868281 RepID=A0ABV7N7C7_9STAP